MSCATSTASGGYWSTRLQRRHTPGQARLVMTTFARGLAVLRAVRRDHPSNPEQIDQRCPSSAAVPAHARARIRPERLERVAPNVHWYRADRAAVLIEQPAHPLYWTYGDHPLGNRQAGRHPGEGEFEAVDLVEVAQPCGDHQRPTPRQRGTQPHVTQLAHRACGLSEPAGRHVHREVHQYRPTGQRTSYV